MRTQVILHEYIAPIPGKSPVIQMGGWGREMAKEMLAVSQADGKHTRKSVCLLHEAFPMNAQISSSLVSPKAS